MAHVSLRVSDQEKALMEGYAKLHGLNLSEAVKEAFFEKLEDEYDLKAIEEFEKTKHAEEFLTFEDTVKELGLEDEVL